MDIQRPQSKQPIPPHAKRVFKGVIFEVYQWEQEMFDGSVETYEALKRADTAQVIATRRNKILIPLEEQPRREPGRARLRTRIPQKMSQVDHQAVIGQLTCNSHGHYSCSSRI